MTKATQVGVMIVSVAIVIEPDGDGFFAYAPALKGLLMDGSTETEALERAREGVKVYLESLHRQGEPLPEGPGISVHPENPEASVQHVTMQWPIPFGTSLETALPTT